jgi:hypothetical protein
MSPLFVVLVHCDKGSYSSPYLPTIEACINHLATAAGFHIQFQRWMQPAIRYNIDIMSVNMRIQIPTIHLSFLSTNVIDEKNRLIEKLTELISDH